MLDSVTQPPGMARGQDLATVTPSGPLAPPPGPGVVHLWWTVLGPGRGALDLLTVEERARVATLARPVDQHRVTAARALLRVVASGWTGRPARCVQIGRRCPRCGSDEHGAPALLDPDAPGALRLSVSHGGAHVVVAASPSALGVDVEPVPRADALDEIAAAALSDTERQAWAQLDQQLRAPALARLWVRKEAVLKATGDGLTVAPSLVRTSAADAPARLVGWDDTLPGPPALSLNDLEPGAGHAAALAVVHPGPLQVLTRRVSLASTAR